MEEQLKYGDETRIKHKWRIPSRSTEETRQEQTSPNLGKKSKVKRDAKMNKNTGRR
jgi:hypothetical protein